jgi:two-component system, OmpR family, response regulator CpxR
VDDDDDYRKILGEVLEGEGCTVYCASDGRRALEVLDVVRPDLVVVDLMMPVMNGWELAAAMQSRETLADIPLVVISSVAKFHPFGRARVLTKPVGLETLVALLDIVQAP